MTKSLEEQLAALDGLLRANDPERFESLRRPVTEEQLAELKETAFSGSEVPREVAALYRWHDGQSGSGSISPRDNRTFMPMAEAVDAWRFLNDPMEDIPEHWSSSWFPLFQNGAGDYVVFETAPDNFGALISYWHDDSDWQVAFESVSTWADAVAAALVPAEEDEAGDTAEPMTIYEPPLAEVGTTSPERRRVGGWLIVYIVFTAMAPLTIVGISTYIALTEGADAILSDLPSPGDGAIWLLLSVVPITVFFTGRPWVAYFNRTISTILAVMVVFSLNIIMIAVAVSWSVYWFRSSRVRETYFATAE